MIKKLEILENKKVIPGQEPSTKDIVTNLESNENIMEDSENKLVNDQNESDLRDLTVSENCPCCEETNFDIHEVVENGYTEPTSIVYNLKNNNEESTIKRKQSRETIWLAPKLIVTETVDHNDIQSDSEDSPADLLCQAAPSLEYPGSGTKKFVAQAQITLRDPGRVPTKLPKSEPDITIVNTDTEQAHDNEVSNKDDAAE